MADGQVRVFRPASEEMAPALEWLVSEKGHLWLDEIAYQKGYMSVHPWITIKDQRTRLVMASWSPGRVIWVGATQVSGQCESSL